MQVQAIALAELNETLNMISSEVLARFMSEQRLC